MQKLIGFTLIVGVTAATAMAALAPAAPEIDATSAASAIGLLVGAALVIRGRRRK